MTITLDQAQATYAAEDLWESKEPKAKTRFGDWNEIWPFYYTLSVRCREHGMGDIRPPVVKPRKGALKAHYDPTSATVHIPPYDRGGVWALNTATAIHEFAHHVGGTTHGPKFRAAMVDCVNALGWDGDLLKDCYANAGLTTTDEDDGIMAHVSMIYAQADAPGRTVEEKQAFLERAQKLATRHQIDLALMRKRQADADEDVDRARPTTGSLFSLMAISSTTHRKLVVDLGNNIAIAHGALCTIRGKSAYMTFYGFPEDIALTELMITSVTPMMFEAADAYVNSQERRSSGVAAVSARITFCHSFSYEVGRRLKEAVKQSTAEAVSEDTLLEISFSDGSPQVTGTELALREKALEVRDFVKHEFKKQGVRGSWHGSRTSSYSHGAASAGKSAAKNVNLFGRKELT